METAGNRGSVHLGRVGKFERNTQIPQFSPSLIIILYPLIFPGL